MALGNGRDWRFYPGNPEKCLINYYYNAEGRCAFSFYYNPVDGAVNTKRYNFEPFDAGWDGTEESLKHNSSYGCYNNESTLNNWHGYCTKLIQYNGWKIPKDYPFRVKYK